MPIKQGEIYNYNFGPQQDNRMEGEHPALIVQTDKLNAIEGYRLVIIVPLSGSGQERSPSHVKVEPTRENGLDKTSFAKCEQIYTVPQSGLKERRGALAKEDLFRVKAALKIVLEIAT